MNLFFIHEKLFLPPPPPGLLAIVSWHENMPDPRPPQQLLFEKHQHLLGPKNCALLVNSQIFIADVKCYLRLQVFAKMYIWQIPALGVAAMEILLKQQFALLQYGFSLLYSWFPICFYLDSIPGKNTAQCWNQKGAKCVISFSEKSEPILVQSLKLFCLHENYIKSHLSSFIL